MGKKRRKKAKTVNKTNPKAQEETNMILLGMNMIIKISWK